ncbi:MAG: STAS domain-containing protein [Burkholderiales bacterium]
MTDPGRIEVSELQGHLSSQAQEAVVCYANGNTAGAIELLSGAIAEPVAGQGIRVLWQMLFELHRVQSNWLEFEALAKRYCATFDKAAPEWLIDESYSSKLPAELRPGGPAYVAVGDALDLQSQKTWVRIRDVATQHSVIHVDLNQLASASPEGCESLSRELNLLISNGNGVYFSGSENLEKLLRREVERTPKIAAYWQLLLDLYRLEGRQRQFESVALEYGLFVEIDPPAWEPALMPVLAQSSPDERRDEPRYANRPEMIFLQGEMTGAVDPQLDAIRRLAHDTKYVNINMSRLSRIDFVCAANLGNTIQALSNLGKTVRLIKPNLLVATLLRMLKIDQHAIFISPDAAA